MLMFGRSNKPGHHLVYEGIDFATLLSIVGGPIKGANLKKVKGCIGNFQMRMELLHMILT